VRSPLKNGRDGVGALLVVILSMIVVLSIIGIGQRFLGSAVSNQTQRASIGDLCLELAESAVEELAHQFRTKANDKRSPIFAMMRKDVYGVSLGNKDLTPYVETPQMAKILQEPAYSKFYLRDVRAEIVFQRQFQRLVYERYALLRLRAQVRFDLSLTESVSREVEVGVGVKINLLGPPRPFDQAGFMLLVQGTAPADMEFAELEQKKRDYTALVQETYDDATKYADHPQTPGMLKDEYREVLTLVNPAEYWQGKLTGLPTENFIMFAGKPPPQVLDVQELFILKKLEEKEKNELAPAARDVVQALRRIVTVPEDIGAHRTLIAAFRRRAKALAGQLTMMQDHRLLFDAKPSPMYDAVMDHYYKLEGEHWDRKPFFVIEEKPGADTANVQLQNFIASLKKPDGTIGPINGVVRIYNTAPVDLSGVDIRGKLTILTGQGGVRLSRLNRGERDQDLLTMISLGGPISIEGDVHAQIIGDRRASFSASPGAIIHGGISLGSVPTPSAREFRLVRMKKYESGTTTTQSAAGAFADYYYVATSPRFVYRKVRR
jgi:hypothetical protein